MISTSRISASIQSTYLAKSKSATSLKSAISFKSIIRRVVILFIVFLIPAVLFISTTTDVSSQTTVINFDQDAAGNDIPDGEAIDDEYASLGVNFDGTYTVCRTANCRPDLTQNTSLNLLCTTALGDSSECTGPASSNATLIIAFDNPVDSVSIEAYTGTGTQDSDQILMQAFNASGALVGEVRENCDNGASPFDVAGVCNPSINAAGIIKVFITPRTLINGFDNLQLGAVSPPEPTAVPPTAVPPTAVPPTAVPPTAVPPTAVPPTAVPPTAVPPTAVPPTAVPEPEPQADLAVTVDTDVASVDVGDSFLYTIDVTNNGPDDAVNVVLTDTLPTGVTVVNEPARALSSASANNMVQSPTSLLNVTPSQGSCTDGTTGTVVCQLGDLASSGSATVVILVEVQAGASGSLVNNASVTSDTSDPTPANSAANSTVSVSSAASSADLSIVKNESTDPVDVGAALTYTVTVNNSGPDTATNVSVVDQLPLEVTYVSADTSQGSCSEASNEVTCDIGDMADGAVTVIVIDVQVSATTTATVISNLASVDSDTSDPEPRNNQALEDTSLNSVVIVEEADVSISKSDSTDPVDAGDTISYTLEIANLGPSDAMSVTVTDQLPDQVTYVSYSAGQGSCEAVGNTLDCGLGLIATGDSVTVIVDVAVNADASGTFTNTASVTTATADPDLSNNEASQATTVNSAPATSADLAITKSGVPATIKPENELVYTLEVVNNGPDEALDVIVTDTLSPDTTFVATNLDDPTCAHDAGIVICSLGNMANGASETITISVTVNADAQGPFIDNTADVASSSDDPDLSNNQSTIQTSLEPLAIDLAEFSVVSGNGGLSLEWETGSEINAEGFNVWRSDAADGVYVQINESLIAAVGDSDVGSVYSYIDTNTTEMGIYYYRLEEIDSSGNSKLYRTVSINTFPVQLYVPLMAK